MARPSGSVMTRYRDHRPLVALLLAVAGLATVFAALLLGSSAARAAGADPAGSTTLGRKELVRVVSTQTVQSREKFARIDTGAERSSIDTGLAKELGLDLAHAERLKVTSSLGEEERPVVGVTLQIGSRTIPTKVTVTDRQQLSSQVLVGRHDLDGFLVDVARTHLTTPGSAGRPSALSLFFSAGPLPPSQGALLAGLAMGATLVVALRQVVGVHTFGTFAPVLLALTYVTTGLPMGLLVTVVVCSLAVLVEPLIRRLRLPRVARLAVLIGTVTVVISANQALFGSDGGTLVGAAFPVVVLAAILERFWECREEDGLRSALLGWLLTVSVAVGVSLVLVLPAVRATSETYPLELAAVLTVVCVLVGRYRGLRASELLRFRAAAAGSA